MPTLVFFWLAGLWLLGWAALPATRRVFAPLSDGGLATGRVLFIAFASLIAFWLASFGIAPLRVAPILFATFALASCSLLLDGDRRTEFFAFVKSQRRALLTSDIVFLAAFLFFGWVRWRNPALNSLEKPMDAALLAQCWRADWLPIQNPWFAGTPFSGYYYFGPFMGANLARCFGGAPAVAYNIAQPAFCALFVSTLFSLCAALLRSHKRGFMALILVAFLGHFEPLRQIVATGALWPLDGWQTSRVIPNTINEYPLFTLVVGDAHAHFYALALEVTLLCVCWSLFGSTVDFDRTTPERLGAIGVLLAVILMTNPWNAPVDCILIAACTLLSLSRAKWLWVFLPFVVARIVLWPHLRVFQPPIGGAKLEFWLPDLASFGLFWGGWLFLAAMASTRINQRSPRADFSCVVAGCGVLALCIPFFVTILGVFQNSQWRHQDTVFKFWLQAWLLFGIAAACGALSVIRRWPRGWRTASVVYLPVPALCALAVWWQWGIKGVPHDEDQHFTLSLDGARHLSADERAALAWLSHHAHADDSVLEAVGTNSYSEFGRVSAITGIPTVLGWPSHVSSWGGDSTGIARRKGLIEAAYKGADDNERRAATGELKSVGVRWIFVGDVERRTYPTANLQGLIAAHRVAFESGETVVLEVK